MSLVLFVFATEYALHCYHVCRVLETLCFAIETAGGVVLSNSAHEVDNAHDVWRSLFPGQSKLPAALIKIPVFSVVTCELRPACSSKTYFIAQYCTGSVNGQGCKGCDLVETFLSFTAAHLLCSGLVAAFLGSGLPIYRIAVLHRIPFIYMLQWIKTWPFIANPADPMLYLLLFSMDLNLIIVQMTILPDNVHLEDNPMPWCMLAGLKYWASEADLLDEQSSDDEDLSDEDVLGNKLYPCCCLLLSMVTDKPASFPCIVSTVLCECA